MGKKKIIKILLKLRPYLLILIITVLFFWKFFFKGLIPVPADITVGMYYPWLDYKWGYSVGVPVKNALLSDVVSQTYPYKIYAMDLLKRGISPLWNPMMFGGFPLLANPQAAIFNPTNILYFVFSNPTAWSIQIFFQPLLAAFFTYLFLRSLKLGELASLFGSVVYAFSGYIMIWLQWNIHGFTIAFLPGMFFVVNEYYFSRKKWCGPALSLLLCLQIFSGYPQIVVYSILTLLLYILFIHGIFRKENILLFFYILLGISLSAIQLFPTGELFFLSQRRFEILSIKDTFLPWQYLTSFFAPDFFGNITTGNFWGTNDYTENIGYSGIIPLILSVIVLKKIKKERIVLFFTVLFVIILFFCLSNPLSLTIKKIGFFGLSSFAFTRILYLCNFSIAALSALSFQFMFKEKNDKNSFRFLLPVPIILLGITIGIILSINQFNEVRNVESNVFLKSMAELWLKNLKVSLKNLIFPAGLCFFTLFLINLTNKIKTNKIIIGITLLFIMVFELFRFGWKFNPFIKKDLLFPEAPAILFLKEQKGIFRVEGGEVIPMNMLLPYNLESYSAYDPMYPLSTAQFMSLIDNGDIKNPKSRYGQVSKFDSPAFDLVNVCYILALKKDKNSKPDQEGKISSLFQSEKLRIVFEDKTTVVLKNLNCYPRAFLISDFSEINNNEVKIKFAEKASEDTVTWVKYTPLFKEARVSTKNDALFFISDSFYPGWKAFVDNKETKILKANYSFQAIKISKGEHKINFIYKPISFFIGLIVSIISGAFILIVLFLGCFEEKLPLLKEKKL